MNIGELFAFVFVVSASFASIWYLCDLLKKMIKEEKKEKE